MSTDTMAAPAARTARAGGRIRRRRSRGEHPPFRLFHLVLYLIMGAGGASAIAAYLWVINASLKTNVDFIGTSPFAITDTWSFGNYLEAWQTAGVATYFGNSVLVSVCATAIGVGFAVLAAYPLARVRFRGSSIVLAVIVSGLMVPWMVTFIPLYLTLQDLGLLDSQLGLILVYATYNLPFNVYVMVGFMKTLPRELEEAAAVDGAGPASAFLRVIVPLLGPGMASITIISFLNNWNEFFYALVFITTPDRMTLPVGLWQLNQAATYGSQWVTLFAGMMITVLPVLVVFAFLQKHITRGLTAGSLK
ncbi:carbohydrate ABC transporter permease [Microlunatus sp. GCM10028923]|uniref:carbohydrate ABC transporter permease n=1 Tax=Microlunatus sp. GCM10028923 TaxID=3273400 RepID=UPI003615B41A